MQFETLLQQGCEELNIKVDTDAIDFLSKYFVELKVWSRKINLISRTMSDEQMVENHFLDSLTILQAMQEDSVRLVDVGTGAGFPGLVCKAARRNLNITLVEPRMKRVSFLKHIVRTLDLKDVVIIAKRLDESVERASIVADYFTSRAVSDIATFIKMVSGFSQPKNKIICMKGKLWQQELDEFNKLPLASQVKHTKTIEFELPFSKVARALLIFEKSES